VTRQGRRRRAVAALVVSPLLCGILVAGLVSAAWPWLALAGLGAFHGLNPAMGWLFAVALGLHRASRAVVLWALLPIALWRLRERAAAPASPRPGWGDGVALLATLVFAALAGTRVPVPPPVAVCEDASVNGAPFAVTRFVDGVVLDTPDKTGPLGDDGRVAVAHHLIDVLADLHEVDVDSVGLGDLSRREGYIERQLRRWSKQWAGSRTRELPVIDEVERRLAARVPEQQGVTIVHGDYRFGNCITDIERRKIAAVLDWELCTLGDAMADLGHMSIYWHDPSAPLPMTNDPTSAPGFPPFEELLQRYAARTGRDVSLIGYYRAFAAWRLAIIAEGVASRHLEHHPDDTAALEASRASVRRLAESALAALGG